jgi:hypothetical protein
VEGKFCEVRYLQSTSKQLKNSSSFGGCVRRGAAVNVKPVT